ncbi:MAG: hypothetical protein ABIP49_08195 [Lysobacterales bacterium]
MSNASPSSPLERLREHLQAATNLRAAAKRDPSTGSARARVRAWQAARLAATYADLVATPQYRPAATFFLSDLYSTGDHSARDAELERALPKLVKLLPAGALDPMELALAADALSEYLDAQLASHLDHAQPITTESYASAYRACNNRTDRVHQIELVDQVGRSLDRIAHAPMLARAVQLMGGPARLAGFGTLQSFLERGLTAFKGMRDATTFLATIKARETDLMERLLKADRDAENPSAG